MTRRYGIDVSHFQDPSRPAGNTWEELGKLSSFAIARASYGCSPDERAAAHVAAARAEAFQVGLFHFPVASQPVDKQVDCFLAQAVKCRVGRGDLLPAIDIEDDGPRKVDGPGMESFYRQIADCLIARFGGVMIYITQRDFRRLGSPAWILDHPLWVAHYTNASTPATPGDRPYTIWQNRVGLYAPGQPFVAKEAYLPNAIDQDVADAPLPICTIDPVLTGYGAPELVSQPSLWQQRLDALTVAEYASINTGHAADAPGFEETESPTKPDNPKPSV